jgi:alpha-mannosidase
VEVAEDAIMLGALKGAEDGGDALVVRAVEISGRQVDSDIRLPMCGRTIPVSFRPHEVRTFLVPADPGEPVTEVNLLEWPDDA